MPSRQLAAIMFTDLVGYTSLMQQNEVLAITKRDRNRKILEESLSKHEGRLLQYYGDGALSIFPSGVNAVKSAVEIQMLNRQDPKIDVRIGIHTGDVMIDDNGVYGDSVNVSSRIESLALPGSILVSEKLYDELKNDETISAKSLGFVALKNVKQPVHIYAITNPGVVVPVREELQGKTVSAKDGIAVLPFTNLSSDAENEFFCDGMTEELINVLAKIEGLQVIARTSVFAFKGKSEDVREIAAKLNVQKIIEGSVRKSGTRIRITVQLINAADGYHIWSESYDRNPEDIFEVQDEIARTIANKLRENLSTIQHESRLSEAPTQNLEAYKKYLLGMQLIERAEPEEKNKALDLLQEAVLMDPEFVNVHALLAFEYNFMGQTGQMPANQASVLAKEHIEKALALDPENVSAMVSLSFIKLAEWKWDDGFELVQRALQINPNNSMAQMTAAEYYLLFLNREKELEHATAAYRLDPLSSNTLGETARHFLSIGKYREALEFADEGMRLDPHNLVSRCIRAYALDATGEGQTAVKEMLETYQFTGDHPLVLMALGYFYARLKQVEKANAILSKLSEMSEQMPDAHFDFIFATIYLTLGDIGKFHFYYDRGINRRAQWIVQFYGSEMLRDMWYDEHVMESRRKLGLPVFERPGKSA